MDNAIQKIQNWIQRGNVDDILDLSFLRLTSLPDLPSSLKILYCYNNQLTSLPDLPSSLKILICDNNKITNLPNLPSSLQKLSCSNNYLTSLPDLPSLQKLSCSNNKLTDLPNLPSSLKILHCNENYLTSLPDLPTNLQELNCNANELTSLPDLPSSLKILSCSSNQLTSLPDLPLNLQVLYCKNNPFLKDSFRPNNPPVKIPYNIMNTDLEPDEYIRVRPIVNIKDVEDHLPSDISYIVDEYLGSSCDMLSEYGDRCGYKTRYTKSYVDKDGELIEMNKQEIDTLIKYGIKPKIINKKYNCVNYCKQHCDLGVSKILDINDKIINIYEDDDIIFKEMNLKIDHIIKNKDKEEKIDLKDICKTKDNYHIELYIQLKLNKIPKNYKIKFEKDGKEIRYISSSKWKLIEKFDRIYAFLEYDLIYNE